MLRYFQLLILDKWIYEHLEIQIRLISEVMAKCELSTKQTAL